MGEVKYIMPACCDLGRNTMQVSDFDFELPDELIARYPQPERTASRLLQMTGNTGELAHKCFKNVLDLVQPGDLLVFNNTRSDPCAYVWA